jgi:hypothetical protein
MGTEVNYRGHEENLRDLTILDLCDLRVRFGFYLPLRTATWLVSLAAFT